MHVGSNPLQRYPFHELEGDVGPAGLLHEDHGRPEDDDFLGDLARGHLVEVLEALEPLLIEAEPIKSSDFFISVSIM